MNDELLSVEQVARHLDLHVRTVRAYIRDGRLKATRIGKQYRIARADLEALTGSPVTLPAPNAVRTQRHVEVSSVVQIEAIDPAAASRISNGLVAVSNSRDTDGMPTRVDCVYNETLARLKIIVTGSVATTLGLLQIITLYLEQ